MSYKTFKVSVWCVVIVAVLGMGWCSIRLINKPAEIKAANTDREKSPRSAEPAEQEKPNSIASSSAGISTKELQNKIENWLSAHGHRRDRIQWKDIMPTEPFMAVAIRFPESDASKWSDDVDQWSQIKIDLNRDGVFEEKWLLKNGHTYKREVIDRNGRTVDTEYLNK